MVGGSSNNNNINSAYFTPTLKSGHHPGNNEDWTTWSSDKHIEIPPFTLDIGPLIVPFHISFLIVGLFFSLNKQDLYYGM